MGDNATGMLGGRFPFPENFVNFSSQNGVLWCIMRVLLLRFMNAVFRMPAEGKKIKHLSKYWGSSTQDDPCRSSIGVRDPCGVEHTVCTCCSAVFTFRPVAFCISLSFSSRQNVVWHCDSVTFD